MYLQHNINSYVRIQVSHPSTPYNEAYWFTQVPGRVQITYEYQLCDDNIVSGIYRVLYPKSIGSTRYRLPYPESISSRN